MVENTGLITGINGNMITVQFNGAVHQNEVGFAVLGEDRLKAEVIRVNGNDVQMQVFEETRGLAEDDIVEFSNRLLSVELGPGLLGQIYDGLQNPLPVLAESQGFFLKKGAYLKALDHERKWPFTPAISTGDRVNPGDCLGHVQEGIFDHKIMVPFDFDHGLRVETIVPAGSYTLTDRLAVAINAKGDAVNLTMSFEWPVKIPITCYKERLLPQEPMITGTRVIDTFFPVARGGTYCIPGPFGAGKTVVQQITSRYAQVDVVIVAACGERAGEVVETMREFPKLKDPKTGKSLMERTVIICNTSSMPVAAREASVYTAVTIAEYYRQMGLDVLLLADSTSRWAQAMREMSGLLEEIPGEEAFPAYLESRIARFYERAGLVLLNDGETGSVTIGGTVSPAGGNFEEPVTQSSLKVVGAFHGLSRERSDARRFPSIHPLESWSKYKSIIDSEHLGITRDILLRGDEIRQMMTVVGEEGVTPMDFVIYLKSELLDSVYLQQNSFDPVDAFCSAERQSYVFTVLVDILKNPFDFSDRDAAREFFNSLRQKLIDWNYSEWKSVAFDSLENNIRAMMNLQGKVSERPK